MSRNYKSHSTLHSLLLSAKRVDTAIIHILLAFQKYAVTLKKQLGLKGGGAKKSNVLGEAIRQNQLEYFSDEQIAQLYELYKEASEPPKK